MDSEVIVIPRAEHTRTHLLTSLITYTNANKAHTMHAHAQLEVGGWVADNLQLQG